MTITTAELRRIATTTPREQLPELTDLLAEQLVSASDSTPPLTIAQVATLLDVSPHTLRWYERIGLVDVPRSAGGQRSYDLAAIARVVFVMRLRMTDMPISGIQAYLRLVARGAATIDERRAMLERHRDELRTRLEDLAFSLAVIDYKITTYGGECSPGLAAVDPEEDA